MKVTSKAREFIKVYKATGAIYLELAGLKLEDVIRKHRLGGSFSFAPDDIEAELITEP